MGNAANPPSGAGRLIEHPGRNLQPSVGCRARDAAAEDLLASLLDHLMNVDLATCPRMPRIKKFTLLGPVGVLSSCCTTAAGPTRALTERPRHRLLQCADANPGSGITKAQVHLARHIYLFRQTEPPLNCGQMDLFNTRIGGASIRRLRT